MRTISVFNLKGGVAKTTTVRNMATILAKVYDKRVLVCDLDSSRNLSMYFNTELPPEEWKGVAKLMSDPMADPHEQIVHTNVEGVDLLPSNARIKDVDSYIRKNDYTVHQHRLRAQMCKVVDEYDYCLFDCPPTEDIISINALCCTDDVIIPFEIEDKTFDSVLRMKGLVEALAAGLNPSLSIKGALLVKVTNDSIGKTAVEIDTGDIPRFTSYIRRSVDVVRCSSENLSLMEYQKLGRHKISLAQRDYDNFVAEYLGLPFVHPYVPYNPDNPLGVSNNKSEAV